MIQKLRGLPVGILPTMMAFASISAAWERMGFTWIRNIAIVIASAVWLLYMAKLLLYWKTCAEEFKSSAVVASVYCAITVLLMIISPWYAQWSLLAAQIVHYTAAIIHTCLVALFTWRYVRGGIDWDTFVPTWFVAYVGVLISNVSGVDIFIPVVPMIILIYGVASYWIVLIPMVIRLKRRPVPEFALHSRAVMVAPASLCVIAYLNVVSTPRLGLAVFFYLLMLANLVYVAGNTPKFFSLPFSPSYAALTFPLAASTLASFRMSDFLLERGDLFLGNAVAQLAGIQMYAATAVIAFVVFNFARMGMRACRDLKGVCL